MTLSDCPDRKDSRCTRYGIKAHWCELCQSPRMGKRYQKLWEQGRGPGQKPVAPLATKPLANGPGTQLKRLLGWLKIVPTRGCRCNQWAALMDLRGCDWCEANVKTIIGWMRKEAVKRYLPFADVVGHRVVKIAIFLARRAESSPVTTAPPMALTQLLCFELGSECNLGEAHRRCPNQHPERYSHVDTSRVLDDDTIVEVAERMYGEFHFTGLVAWHYYNEPLIQAQRMFGLMDRIKERVPQSRFLLWTNGTYLPEDCSEFRVFDQAFISTYHLRGVYGTFCDSSTCSRRDFYSLSPAEALKQHVRKVIVLDGNLDGRLDAMGETENDNPCARMHVEFVVDNFGNVHLCCHDWRGLASPGNVFRDDLAILVSRWERIRDSISGQRMTEDAPEVCRRCRMRSPKVFVLDRRIGDRIAAYRRLWKLGTGLKVAVVLCHYEIPDWRLREHFTWNDRLYRQAEARVYVVTDQPYDVPDYAECIVFPKEELPTIDGQPAFWITGLKNVGLKRAIADGAELVVCSDTDIAYTPEAWDRMITVGPDEAVIPIYHKVKHFERRYEDAFVDPGCGGVISMWTEHWAACPWEEGCIGYGADDRVQQNRIEEHLGRAADRSVIVHHLDHHPQDGVDHGLSLMWNRDTLNPPNFTQNRQYVRKKRSIRRWQPKRAKR